MSIKKIIAGLTLSLLLSSGMASADYNSAYSKELSPESTLLYVTSRLAIINSHPGMYSKLNFIGKHLMKDLDITLNDIDEALEFCNAEGMAIMAALKITG